MENVCAKKWEFPAYELQKKTVEKRNSFGIYFKYSTWVLRHTDDDDDDDSFFFHTTRKKNHDTKRGVK